MDIRKTARGAWLGMIAGLLIGTTGAVRATAAEATQPAPKTATSKTAAPKQPVAQGTTTSGAGVDKGETKEMKAKRLNHEQKAKVMQASGVRGDLDNLKALREGEKARQEAEKAKRSRQEPPGNANTNGKEAK